MAEYPFRCKEDIENYLELIKLSPSYFDSLCQFEEEKFSRGFGMADYSLDKVTEQCRTIVTKEELQKLRKSVATKIGRAKNMLEYQQETKAESPNPMPESPKRVKYETKIANLSRELEQIDYAIAKLGWFLVCL